MPVGNSRYHQRIVGDSIALKFHPFYKAPYEIFLLSGLPQK